jgi:phosphatidylglycerol---prolipoprotein diacylglyceryl transferase
VLEFWQQLALKIDPVAFSLLGFEVRYYGLMYIVAFLVTYGLIKFRLKREPKFKDVSLDTIEEIFLLNILAVFIGGRLGYVLFYDLAYYLNNPLQIILPYDFATNQFVGIAGMSFHGGLIAVLLFSWIYIKIKKLDFTKLAALVVPVVPLGYMFGRIGNFLNNELWGSKTEFFLGMQRDLSESFLRHPTQLYEAFFEGFILFIILWMLRNNPKFENILVGLFLIGYGVFRYFIEFIRVPDDHLGYLALGQTMGQWLCIAMIFSGLVNVVWIKLSHISKRI